MVIVVHWWLFNLISGYCCCYHCCFCTMKGLRKPCTSTVWSRPMLSGISWRVMPTPSQRPSTAGRISRRSRRSTPRDSRSPKVWSAGRSDCDATPRTSFKDSSIQTTCSPMSPFLVRKTWIRCYQERIRSVLHIIFNLYELGILFGTGFSYSMLMQFVCELLISCKLLELFEQ